MSIDIQKTVTQVFSTIKAVTPQVVKSVLYKRVTGTPTYNTTTGETTATVTSHTVDAILVQFKQREKEYDLFNGRKGIIEKGDLKALIPYSSLSFEPSLEDTITIDGVDWLVVDYGFDPTIQALHTIQVRRT